MTKIYVASSWRNVEAYPLVVHDLRNMGHEVYDFKNPPRGTAFAWRDIDQEWSSWTAEQYNDAMQHPIARAGFASDFEAMQWCEAGVLVLPCGKSAHLEAGWLIGQGKPVAIWLTQLPVEAELMYGMANKVCATHSELMYWARSKHVVQAGTKKEDEARSG